MNNLQKIGGIAALINGLAYIVGIGLAVTLLAPVLDSEPGPYVAFLADNETLLFVWHLIIYVVAGIFMVPLVLALHERLKAGAPALAQMTGAFGLIWAGLVIASGMLLIHNASVVAELYRQDPAQATTIWLALSTVEDSLGGAIELPGGVWILLVSWAGLQTQTLPRALNYLGLLIGVTGIATVVPALYEGTTVFGLGFIIWFLWAGIVMVRSHAGATAQSLETFAAPTSTTA